MSLDTNLFTGRELSWLQFNKRVLEEAYDPSNPLLEQCRFLSIFASNLDEYFMIRVSGMKGQVDLKLTTPDRKTGYMAEEYLKQMLKKTKKLVDHQYSVYHDRMNELNEYIDFVTYDELSTKHKKKMDNHFKNLIYPILTPIRFSRFLPFPLLPNLSVYLISQLEDANGEVHYSVVTVPRNVERIVQVKKDVYVLLEDIIIHNINILYEGLNVVEVVPFRITRDWDIEFNDQTSDFARSVETELKNRKRGQAIRLEIHENASFEVVQFLEEHLPIDKRLIFRINGPLDLRFLNEFFSLLQGRIAGLAFEPIKPIDPAVFNNKESLFDVLRRKDVLLFHPHHSYEPVIQMLKEAKEDDNVVAIKQTIYRTSIESRIMKYLVSCAESGKQVTVLFELRARFDEENNLNWGNILERAGAHVIYGVPQLKTHSKVLLIVRRSNNKIERFVHFSTGNYNEENAKIYTDASYFTAKKTIGDDATKFFNYISSYSTKPQYKKLIASPDSIRDAMIQSIDQEIQNQVEFGNGRIIMKMNSITDVTMIKKLYDASQVGVKIDLIVRGICCLKPQVEGYSDNIRVISIVGRYLEHMRIYYFYNNGIEDTYLSSADLMTRNMESRIELALKVTDKVSKNKITRLLKLQLTDNMKARENVRGSYDHIPHEPPIIHSQMDLYKLLK